MASFGSGRCSALLVLGLTASMAACAADCSTEALAEQSAAQRFALVSGACNEVNQYSLETPRARPVDVRPSLVKARFGSTTSQPLFSGLLGTFKFNWAGASGQQETNGMRTEQAALGAGTLLRMADFWSMQMNFGRELGVNRAPGALLRSRTAVASIVQPTAQSLVFAEWAENEAGLAQHRVGAQWWLMPKMLVLDIGARYLPTGSGWTDQRVGLRFQVTH
jgi:hypothetical protein